MGMDKTAGRTVARVAVDRAWGALDIVTAAGAGRRARGREPLPGAGSGSWAWGPGRCGVWAGREQQGREPRVSGSWAFSPVACPPARAEENAQMVRAAAPAPGQVVAVWHMLWGTYSALGAGALAVTEPCSQPQKGDR